MSVVVLSAKKESEERSKYKHQRSGCVAQHIRLTLQMPASHIRVLVLTLDAPFFIHFPTHASATAVEDSPRTQALVIYVGDQDRLPGS